MTHNLLLRNAHIYLGAGQFAQSLLAVDGVIRAVGTNEAVAAAAPADCEVIDAEGRTAVPGFNDSHCHLLMLGHTLRDVQLHGTTGIADLKARIRAYLETHRPKAGTVIHGMGWNQDYFEDEHRLPCAADLDEAAPGVPLILERACGHILVASTAAMEMAGITDETEALPGGAIDRDENGRATGIFRENAAAQVTHILPAADRNADREALLAAFAHAAECGVTSVHTMDVRGDNWRDVLSLYAEVLEENPCVRVNHQCCFMEKAGLEDFLRAGNRTGTVAGHPMNKVGPLKLFVDGSLGARTALLRAPYADDPSTSGIGTIEPDALADLVGTAVKGGMQATIHAIGDGAIERVLDAYEPFCRNGENPMRLGIVHVQITDRPLLERMAAMGVLAHIQPIFLHYDMHVVADRVGEALASTSYAFKTMLNLGIPTSLGTDSPVEDINAIDNLYCAVNRRDLKGDAEGQADGFYAEEKLSVEEAVDCYTAGSAFASFEENVKGRLLPGYAADLVLLSDDIFTRDPLTMREIRVDRTIVNGRTVFVRE